MNLPEGRIVHRSAGRLRVRIPEMRKNRAYFEQVHAGLQKHLGIWEIRVNPDTASVLISAAAPDVAQQVADAGISENLFDLESGASAEGSVRQIVYTSFDRCNESVKSGSGGELDLPVLIFLVLISTGIYQLLRNGFSLPPWYTAFWYALGVFTKSIIDGDGEVPDDGGE